MTTNKETIEFSHELSHYILSTCWPKMLQRITHWLSQGFIFNLGKLEEDDVRSAFLCNNSCVEVETKKQASDTVLHNIIMNDSWAIEGVLNTYSKAPFSTYLKLPNLCAAFGVGWKPEEAYNVNTCFEFHQLLVATLIGYGQGLAALKKAISDEKGTGADKDDWRWYATVEA
jgi:hypothetical protein